MLGKGYKMLQSLLGMAKGKPTGWYFGGRSRDFKETISIAVSTKCVQICDFEGYSIRQFPNKACRILM